jgi:hypothetical protein
LSTNSGSLDSLKVWLRYGCRPNALHIRQIVVCEKPVSAAFGIDQCVAFACGAQRPLDHSGNLIVVDGSRPARTSLVVQTIAAIF